jgi:hypothetical protein
VPREKPVPVPVRPPEISHGLNQATLPCSWVVSAAKILAYGIVWCGRFRGSILPTSSVEGLQKSEILCLYQGRIAAYPNAGVPRFSSDFHANTEIEPPLTFSPRDPKGRYQRQVGHDPTDAVPMVTRDSHITGLAPCAIDTHIRGQHALCRAVRGQDTLSLSDPPPRLMIRLLSVVLLSLFST